MKRHAGLLLLVAAMLSASCQDATAPPGRLLDADSLTSARDVVPIAGPEELPPEVLAELPDEFLTTADIRSLRTEVGIEGNVAWATATATVFASHADLHLRLKVKDTSQTELAADSTVTRDYSLLPTIKTLVARVNITLSRTCSLLLQATSAVTAWHSFPLPPTGISFRWGDRTRGGGDGMATPLCPPPPPPPSDEGDYDDEYEGDCELCQQWFWVVYGEILDEWWECSEVDGSLCASGSSNG